jgi:predicted kinase
MQALVMMCGLPASGKTTSAMRIHDSLGGVLIRSCDVYEELGIVVSDWIRRTKGFTVNLMEYDRLRDEAYSRMWLRADEELAAGAPLVVVDFAHPDLDKRQMLYTICLNRGAVPVVVLCRCDDFEEVRRRFGARRGRETEPEHEASDLSVFDDIRRRWQSPVLDLLENGNRPTIMMYDTVSGAVTPIHITVPAIADGIRATLETRRGGVSHA